MITTICNIHTYIHTYILLFLMFISVTANAQKVRVIDNKGTLKTAGKNKVFSSNTNPNLLPNESENKRAEGDIWYNPNDGITKVWDVYLDTSTTPVTKKGKWEILIDKPIYPNILRTSSNNINLNESHHTIVATPSNNNNNIHFPKPSENIGKIYRIKVRADKTINIKCADCGAKPFLDNEGAKLTELEWNKLYIFQSDGVKWQQINNP